MATAFNKVAQSETAKPEDRFLASQSDEGRYRLLVEAVIDYAIYMLDPNGIVTSWNPGARRFKGYSAHEIIGHHFSEFYGPEDRARGLPERALATAAREGKFEDEGWRIRKDGTRFWAHVVLDTVRSPEGALIGFAKITRDLTERKVAEDNLRRSEDQFRLLVQSVTDYAIYMLDAEGMVSSWNAGAQRIKGYAPEEIIGRHFSRFYTAEDRAAGEPARALKIAAETGRYEREALRVRKDGTPFWAHVVIDPIRAEDGTMIGYAKVTRDVTERREAQLQLERTQAALLQAQKNEAIGQLTGGVAHDFNNLLMAVLGSLELARKRLPKDPQLARLVDNATEAAQRGTELTQRMLAFARRQTLTMAAIDLPGLVRGMVELLQRSIGPTVTIETRFPLVLKNVRADANQLEMALLNLAVNARDAMPKGGPIVISAREERIEVDRPGGLPAGLYICLAVSDRGEGMSPEVLARATEPFFTTKGVGKGTGLGLAMVHGMAEQSGGRLILDSRPGAGTTAEIWLPAVTAAVAEPELPVEPDEAPGMAPLRVLAVDDDPLVLFNTAAMLEDMGHAVVEAASGREALVAFGAGGFDLVITDQAMPEMSGTQLVERVHLLSPDTPTILATGYAELSGGAINGSVLLNKPFTQYDLARAIGAARAPAEG